MKKRGCIFLQKSNSEECRIRYQVRIGNKKLMIDVGHKCRPDCWDKESQRMKRNTMNEARESASIVNMDIEAITRKVESTFNEFASRGEEPNYETFKIVLDSLLGKEDRSYEKPLRWYILMYINKRGEEGYWEESTERSRRSVLNQFADMFEGTALSAVGGETLSSYVARLSAYGNENTTIEKDVKILKSFLRWASKYYEVDASFEQYVLRLKKSEKQVIFLTDEELEKLEKADIKSRYLIRTRDVFLFSCYTSMRFSDMEKLRKSDIGKDVIDFTTKKTSDHIRIELNPMSRSILEKYRDIPGDLALPIMNNQDYNRFLKKMGEAAGIDSEVTVIRFSGAKRIEETKKKYELISSHTGRRTFICRALAKGIPADVVMKWTGHSDYDAMKPYIGVADSVKRDYMKKFCD